MNLTGPTTRYGVPPARPTSTSLAKFASETSRADFRERMAAQFLSRTLPAMSQDERFAFEERMGICMFDGNMAEADAVHHCAVGSPPAAIDGRQCHKFVPRDDTQSAFYLRVECQWELKRI